MHFLLNNLCFDYLICTITLGVTTLVDLNVNESLCLPFPNSTIQCDFETTALFLAISHDCNIRVNPKVEANNTACYRKFKKFEIEIDSTRMQVCLSNIRGGSNGTVLNFMCMKQCYLHNCRVVYHHVSSHQMIS